MLAVLAACAVALVQCNGVEVRDYSAIDGGGACTTAPRLACTAAVSGEVGCVARPDATDKESQLPMDAGFPVGCQAYFRGADCSSRGFCTCDSGDGGTPNWNCHDADGG